MAHIHQHTQALGFLYKGSALIRQTAAGDIGTGERIFLVPAQAHHPEADHGKILQQFRIIADARSALQGQNGGHHALCPVLLNLFGRIGNGNAVAVFVDFPLNGGQFPLEDQNRIHTPHGFGNGGGKAGKTLGVACQL